MSSISGRFLYQFGITAAVAILVSLLVSFTLTPMMSARLLQVAPRTGHGRGRCTRAPSRAGFYGYIDRAYTAMLALVDAPPPVVAGRRRSSSRSRRSRSTSWSGRSTCRATSTRASSRSSVTAPEGTSLAAMDDVMRRDREARSAPCPACASCWPAVGGGFLGGGQPGRDLRPHRAARGARLLAGRAWSRASSRSIRWRAFRGNYTQREVMQQVRGGAAASSPICASQVRNIQSFNFGGGRSDIDFAHPRPGPRGARRRTPSSCASSAPELGIVDADTTLQAEQAGAAGADRPRARRRSRRRHAGHRHGAAPDGRRRRRGHALPRCRRSTTTTTCSCA